MKRTEPRPQIQPVADALNNYMAEHNISTMELCEKLYGRKESNNSVQGCGNVYPVLACKNNASPNLRKLCREKLGLELPEAEGIMARTPKTALTPVRAALQAYQAAGAPREAETPMPVPPAAWGRKPGTSSAAPPRLAFVLGQDGAASISFNLIGVAAKEAIAALQVLLAADLVALPAAQT